MFDHLLDRYGAYAVGLNSYNYGEPLLNRSRPKLIRRQAKRCPLHTVLSTSLSVERCDAEDVRRKLRSRTLLLVWNVLGFEHNIHEYRAPRRMARRFGVALFHLTRPVDVSWDDPAVWRADVQTRLWGFHWRLLPRCNACLERGAAAGRVFPFCRSPFSDGQTRTQRILTIRHCAGRPGLSSPRVRNSPATLHIARDASGIRIQVDIGSEEVWRYFLSAHSALFDARSPEMLADC